MRIIYVIERLSGTGGLQRILTDKMNFLAEHTAHEIVLMTVWQDDRTLPYRLSPHVRLIRLNVPPTLLALPLALWRFNKYIKRANPDITVFFRAVGAFLTALTTWKGKKIFEAHLDYNHSNHNWLYPMMQKKTDCVVCLTNGDKDNYKIAKRVEVIPNFTTLQCVEQPTLMRKRCLAVGRLCKEKNFERLINLWKEIHQANPEWMLDIYGEGEEREYLQKYIAELNLDDTVNLCGNTDKIKEQYLDSSMLLMTSRTEGMPMALLEAMTCGIPVVSFDCKYGPADLIDDGVNGYLIPYDDDEMFIKRVNYLINDKEQRLRMGAACKNTAAAYTPAAIMSQWLKLYAGL